MRRQSKRLISPVCIGTSDALHETSVSATIRRLRTAVITGGSSGIGLATARLLARRGGWRIVLAARDEARLDEAADELGAVAVRCDVANDADVRALVERALAEGGCDLLVHSSGVPGRQNVLAATGEDWRRVMEINYVGCVRVFSEFWPQVLERKGRMAAVVSVAGTVALVPSAPYAASKHATLSFVRAFGAAAREQGVTVTAVNPGPVPTPGFPQGQLLKVPGGRLLTVSPERCAARLLKATDRGLPEVYVPHFWRFAAAFQALTPGLTARVAEIAWSADETAPKVAAGKPT